MRTRILGNPDELGKAVARIVTSEEDTCTRRPDASGDVVNARRLVAFSNIWDLVHEHTVGYADEEASGLPPSPAAIQAESRRLKLLLGDARERMSHPDTGGPWDPVHDALHGRIDAALRGEA